MYVFHYMNTPTSFTSRNTTSYCGITYSSQFAPNCPLCSSEGPTVRLNNLPTFTKSEHIRIRIWPQWGLTLMLFLLTNMGAASPLVSEKNQQFFS